MSHNGRLKIFLGYASGVGKSRRMLEEGVRRRERGQDVVVGALQANVSSEIRELAQALEIVPMREESGIFSLDLEALLRRAPQICIVDGLAYNNPAGYANLKRWQDVELLLANNVSVLSSINVQYIEEQQNAIEAITGRRAAYTVPQDFLLRADEIVIVDAPAEEHPGRGFDLIGSLERDQRALSLSRLRELALVLMANAVDKNLDGYLKSHDIHGTWRAHERILVCLTPKTNAEKLLSRGRSSVARFHGELLVAYMRQGRLSKSDRLRLEQSLEMARESGARTQMLTGPDPVRAIVEFARAERITQIFIGHSIGSAFWERWFRTGTSKLVTAAGEIDVQIFPH